MIVSDALVARAVCKHRIAYLRGKAEVFTLAISLLPDSLALERIDEQIRLCNFALQGIVDSGGAAWAVAEVSGKRNAWEDIKEILTRKEVGADDHG